VPGLNAPPAPGLRTVDGSASSAPLLAILLATVVLVLGGYAGSRAWRTAATRAGKGGV
jgi:hypothetical protein